MTRRTVDHLLHLMRHVANETIDSWARKCAKDMVARTHRWNLKSSPKQRAMIKRLADELVTNSYIEVIEGDDG